MVATPDGGLLTRLTLQGPPEYSFRKHGVSTVDGVTVVSRNLCIPHKRSGELPS